MRHTLPGSFSAVSKPNFAKKYALESSRQDLQNALSSFSSFSSVVADASYYPLITGSIPAEAYSSNTCFFFADFAERDVTPKKRFSVVVSCSTSFHRKNRPAEKSFSVVVRQQAEGLVDIVLRP